MEAYPWPDYAAVFHEGRGDRLQQIGRDGEPDVLRVGNDCGIDADHLAAPVEQRAAGIAGVDGRVGLDERLAERQRRFWQNSVETADDPAGVGLVESGRISDGYKCLADQGLV